MTRATYGGVPMSILYPTERETTDADLARDALDDLRSAARQFADAWRVAQRAINSLADTGYDWTIDDASETYTAMQDAPGACRRYADAVEANIAADTREPADDSDDMEAW